LKVLPTRPLRPRRQLACAPDRGRQALFRALALERAGSERNRNRGSCPSSECLRADERDRTAGVCASSLRTGDAESHQAQL